MKFRKARRWTMASCKIRGEPVRCARVFHAACWERAAKRELETFCDHDCRRPRECGDEESLRELHCSGCALVRLLNLGL